MSSNFNKLDHFYDDFNSHSESVESEKNSIAEKKLKNAVFLALLFMLIEIVGGIFSNSLAIVTDAAHILCDITGFIMSLLAIYISKRKANNFYTYGFRNAEIIGALASVMLVWFITGILVFEAVQRLYNPSVVKGGLMSFIALVALLFNFVLMKVLGHDHHCHYGHSHGPGAHDHHHNHGHNEECRHEDDHCHGCSEDLESNSYPESPKDSLKSHVRSSCEVIHLDSQSNGAKADSQSAISYKTSTATENKTENMALDAAFIHVIGDLIQSVGVLIGAVLIWAQPWDIGLTSNGISRWVYADPICTLLFSLLVIGTTVKIIKDSVSILMARAPEGVKVESLLKKLKAIQFVKCVHDIHVWSIGTGSSFVTAHLSVVDSAQASYVITRATEIAHKMKIFHTTFQVECEGEFDPKIEKLHMSHNARGDCCVSHFPTSPKKGK